MSFTDRIDRFQQRHPAMGFPLAVFYKFFDDQGGYLAALIAYFGFISLFPLLLLFSTVLGIVLAGDPELQQRIIDSAMSQIPLIGEQLGQPEGLSGGTGAIVIGVLGSLYGGLGVAVAAQNAMNVAWSVPKNDRPDPVRARVRGFGLLLTVGTAVIGVTVLNGFNAAGFFGTVAQVLVTIAAIVLNTATFVVAFRLGTTRAVSVRDVLPGAVIGALLWQALQSFGGLYVQRVVGGADTTNGVFAIVLGLLAFLYISSLVLVLCIEVNVVRTDRLHPRALLTPFTDNVELTDGDRDAYTAQAEAQRSKGFEEIEVTFGEPDGSQSTDSAR
ncbi:MULTISPECIES: YihY/virulence factor BrkB family protein [unclassified Rhodococcus (in: high G+C Gram-positive bacteria)]|uniref:YihY/virulence factor BrkB family protein n=1 Tax=unclassified Rhodococcus (in: high G+C Gram-positive bacteria) TaxID=192944 RepID=UPI00056499EF|nr:MULTISPECIES: YihY/virulence factor BrkB family protein [unclassified Rhodococcus (in: high G+C Gram-positive bacteria)]KQU30739.1 ribonuclease BN [Rhodococcus sp. Leaf225]KQU44821.1 ribonuclease BN [Rhodococcus sp. Leaf258]MBY6675891.1 YihY/virulence factor BrkB family protein [Rhodococcus sp. BP-332]MBY6705760.1 YihY/virulence factor BrkB family protein [Rhodococcus sp. BP-241]MDQ1179971.1 membrane protein [Rhodococcus sp. SORGH_AS_0301]